MISNEHLDLAFKGLSYVNDAVFVGLRWIVPVLFVFTLVNNFRNQQQSYKWVLAAGQLLLIGGLLFVAAIALRIGHSIYLNDLAQREMIKRIATGPHWYQIYVPLINFAVLPLLMFFRRFRRNVFVMLGIVIFWLVSSELVVYFTNLNSPFPPMRPEFNLNETISKVLLFLSVYVLFVWKASVQKNGND